MPSAALPATDLSGERDNASTDFDLGYEHKYGEERHVLASPLPAGPSDQQPIPRLPVAGPTHAPMLDPAYLSNANLNDGGPIGTPPSKLDYEKPLDNDGKLELGYKTILRESNEDQQFWQRDSAGTPFVQAYDFRYREDIHAGLTSPGAGNSGLGDVQVGGRGEVVYTTAELHGRQQLTLPPLWPNSADLTPPSSTTTPASTPPPTSATRWTTGTNGS